MRRNLLQKLNSKRGYSLTEMLATILIMGFVGVIITTGAATVQRVYRKVVAHANAQTALSTTISLMKDQLAFADPESVSTDPGTGQSSTITYKSLNSGELTITMQPGSALSTETSTRAAMDEGGSSSVPGDRGFTLSYRGTGASTEKILLLTDSAITSDLVVTFDDSSSGFTWDESTKTITVENLIAKDLRTGTVQARASFTVRLANDK